MIRIKTNRIKKNINYVEYDTAKNWISGFPTENWCLVIITNNDERRYYDEIIRKSLNLDVGYICAIGKHHDLVHDLADEEIKFREVDFEEHYLPTHTIMTVGDENLEKGLWFSVYCTLNDGPEIKNIVIIDLTKSAYKEIKELIERFDLGYTPS